MELAHEISKTRSVPFSASSIVTFVLALTAACVYLQWTWTSELVGFGGDNAVYIFTAQAFSPYHRASSVAQYFAVHSQYPPLYPLLISLVGGSDNLLIAHLATTTFLLGALVLLYSWGRLLGFSHWISVFATLTFAILPGTYHHALFLLTEYPFLFFSLLGIVLGASAELTNCKARFFGAALAIAAATLTRTAGVALIGAWTLYLVQTRPVAWRAYIATAIAPVALWHLFGHQHGSNYVDSLASTYGNDAFETQVRNVAAEIAALALGWQHNLSGAFAMPLLSACIASLCVIAAIFRAKAKCIDGWFSLLYLAMIIFWPFPAEAQRLLITILPVGMFQALWLLSRLFAHKQDVAKIAPSAMALFLAVVMLQACPELFATNARYVAPLPKELEKLRHDPAWYRPAITDSLNELQFTYLTTTSLKSVADLVPEGECIYSIKPSIVSFYTHRLSKGPPRYDLSDEAFWQQIKNGQCRYFYLVPFPSPSYGEAFYPYRRIESEVEVLREYKFERGDAYMLGGVLGRLKPSS